MKSATIEEITQEICAYQEELFENISQESVDVYLWLQEEFERGDILQNRLFQFVHRSFYRLDGAGLSEIQKAEYFVLMSQGTVDLKKILDKLYEFPTLRKNNTIQFSFATKLIHTIDNTAPIFDAEVGRVFHKAVSGKTKDAKIESAENIYSELINIYQKLLENSEIKKVIQAFNMKFVPTTKVMSAQKVLDFLLWSLGRTKRTTNRSTAGHDDPNWAEHYRV